MRRDCVIRFMKHYQFEFQSAWWLYMVCCQFGNVAFKMPFIQLGQLVLTHWGRVTHICVTELTIIISDNALSPGRRQAIIWNNAGLLLIEPWGINFSEISIGIQTSSFKKMHLNMSSANWRPFCLGLNVLTLGVVRDFNGSRRSSGHKRLLKIIDMTNKFVRRQHNIWSKYCACSWPSTARCKIPVAPFTNMV